MANQITVDSFVIEMSLQETVLRGLQRLEKQILPVAKRIEKNLDQVFSKNRAKLMEPTFRAIEKRAAQAGRNINKSLSDSFRIRGADTGLFTRYQREGQAAAREVGRAIRDAYRIRGAANPPLPRSGQSRLTPRQRIESLAERARTSALYGNLQLRDPVAAQRYNSRLQMLQMQHVASGDLRSFYSNLRRLNFEVSQQIRAASMQRASARLAAMESNSLGSALGGLSGAALPLVGAFMALHKGMQFLQESLEEGAKRQQAHNMMLSSYGSEQGAMKATLDAGDISEHYGLDTVTVRQQLASLRATMPKSFLSDERLAQFYANESVFAHNSGMSADDQFGLNRALQQIAASPKLNMQDWNQVIQRSPALVNKVAQQLGVDSSKVREELKKLSGRDVAKLLMDAMVPTPEEEKRARDNILAARGRMFNAERYAMDKTFRGYQSHLTTLFDSLASTFNNSGGLFERGGQAIGWFLDRLNDITKTLDNVGMNVDGYLTLFEEKWDKFYSTLSPSTQKALDIVKDQFNTFFDWLIVTATAALALGGLKLGGRMLGIGRTASSTASTTASSGVIGGAAGKAFGIAAAAYIGVEIGNLIFDKWIPEFQKFAHEKFGWGGATGTETTHGGNAIKDSWVDKGWTWIDSMYDRIKSAPVPSNGFPLLSPDLLQNRAAFLPQAPVQFAPLKIEIVSNGQMNVALPDGTIQRVALDTVQQQYETQMMSAQGLAGGWQGAGQNAGFSPSSLMRK
ncbi:tape measure protein [Pantoea eucrina]|uniref:tape measure protein n=1 Tax=Pantoea eucrina TaxID=472693 RepID=UPI001CC35DCF|nr:tape measure protein [Pantoea eucrina]UBB13649.1 tape measure protein [Pantoea eucrina]